MTATRTARRIVESGEALSVSNAEIRALAIAYLEMRWLLKSAIDHDKNARKSGTMVYLSPAEVAELVKEER